VSETPDSAERREQILGEVAEGLHAIFKETQRRALEAEDNDELVSLSGSLCKLARGVRQCLAMHAKLQRERLADEDSSAESRALTRFADVQDRKAAIARRVTRRFNEAWPDDDEEDENEVFNQRLESLNERLDDLAEDADFLELDPDVLIARLCEEFGLEPPQPLKPLGPATPDLIRGGTQAESETTRPLPHKANGHAPPADSS